VPKKFSPRRLTLHRGDLALFTAPFWWTIAVASLLSLARFSPAFLVLKAHSIGIDVAFVPIVLISMHLVYAAAAYPFGILADHINRRFQLVIGAVVLAAADLILADATEAWVAVVGAGCWGLQMAVTQGLLAASIADAAPERLRGAAFGIYDTAVGTAAFIASSAAGTLWAAVGPGSAFGLSCVLAVATIMLLLFQPKVVLANRLSQQGRP
jgi:MFS family permease